MTMEHHMKTQLYDIVTLYVKTFNIRTMSWLRDFMGFTSSLAQLVWD
jgi:hypothetical protein